MGNARDQNRLGEILTRKDMSGVEYNPVEAVKWFRKAAEQNYPRALSNLGLCYEDGKGVAKDTFEAYKFFLLAAAHGDGMGESYVVGFESTLSPGQITKAKEEVQSLIKEAQAKADLQAKIEAQAKADEQAKTDLQAKLETQAKADEQAKGEVETYKKDLVALALGNTNVTSEVNYLQFLLSQEQIAKAKEEIQPQINEAKAQAELKAKEAEAQAKAEAQALVEAKAKADAQAKVDAQAKIEAQTKADADAKEAQAQAEIQAKAEAQAKQTKTIEVAGFLLASLVASIFIFKKTKKKSDAARSKKVSELSAKLSALKAEMDRETESYESWSKKQPEAWKNIKTHLVDSYLASEIGQLLNKWDFGNSEMEMRMGFVRKEQAFLPPSARPSDEQWQAALKPKVEPEADLAKQRLTRIRDILLSRLAPNYETQQYDMADLDVKFSELDLEKTDASSNEPMSDKEIAEMVASLTEEIKAIEAGPADEFLSAIKKVSSDRLEYLRSAMATGSPALPSTFLKIGQDQLDRLLVENAEKKRLLKLQHPEHFN
jgi:hypothetical protein